MKEYYEILGLTEEESKLPWDSFQEICKKKYRVNALKFHPDRWVNGTDEEKKTAEDKFKQLNEAYSVLSDKQKRQAYDSGMDGEWHDMGDFNPFDIFEKHFGSNPFGGFNPFSGMWDDGGNFRSKPVKRGNDVTASITLTMEEANKGVSKTISYDIHEKCGACGGTGLGKDGKIVTCPYCNGTGIYKDTRRMGFTTVVTQSPCHHCNGTGKKVENPCPECGGTGLSRNLKKETVTISIPVGVAPGEMLVVQGRGDYPEGGEGIRGDLKLYVSIDMPGGYSFSNNMGGVQYQMEIPFYDAMLGCERDVKFPSGEVKKIKINKNTKNGTTYTHQGEGMKLKDGKARSSFDIKVSYTIPDSINKKQEEILKDFKNITENGN